MVKKGLLKKETTKRNDGKTHTTYTFFLPEKKMTHTSQESISVGDEEKPPKYVVPDWKENNLDFNYLLGRLQGIEDDFMNVLSDIEVEIKQMETENKRLKEIEEKYLKLKEVLSTLIG